MELETLSANSERNDARQMSDSQSHCLAVFLPLR